ncbi:MAG: hypothetical protein A2133_04635 [Actinobacteria bacterium RBG_16_64_13]|nr:MAG: hypothetical protein A2133_04635 [Actinobacteria bacterium RBG_16_64_13]
MADRETLMRRQDLLRSRLRRPGIKLALHGADKSHLEAALARGGEEMGAVIENAWRSGARYDSWTEEFRADAWSGAFAAAGTSAEELATAVLRPDAALPWDVISGTVGRDYLRVEWEKAQRGESTPDCRWEGCGDCGACEGPYRNDLAAEFAAAVPVANPALDATSAPVAEGSAVAAAASRWPYVATFSVTGRGRFIGHLDRVEIFRRAIRRAGGRLALSAGMRPKPLLSLALPLAVGVEGLRELCAFQLAEEPDSAFVTRLTAALPAHMRLLALETYSAARSLPARVTGALYQVRVCGGLGAGDLATALEDAARRFREAAELPTEDTREGRVRRVDVKSYVDEVSVASGPSPACTVSFRTAVTPGGTARPERVVAALGGLAEVALEIEGITRMEVILS